MAPANSRGHLFWYWRRFGAVWASAGFVRSGLASRAGAGFVRSGPASRAGAGFVRSGPASRARLAQLRAPAWAKPLGPAWASAVLGVAGRGDVLALAPFAFQDAHQDSVKVASHVVNHFATAAFSDKTYRFI